MMNRISALVNFEENISLNLPKYEQLLFPSPQKPTHFKACEYALLAGCGNGDIVSRICEGYQFIIAFNGRLFNPAPLRSKLLGHGYRFLDESDAELALFCYIHFGKTSPELLVGDFSYIIYDSMRRCLFCTSGGCGSIFFSETDGAAAVCSSPIGLIHLCSRRMEREEIARLVFTASSESLLGIKRLPPKHCLEISQSGTIITSCTPCRYPSPLEIAENYTASKYASVIYTGTENDKRLLEALKKFYAPEKLTLYTPLDNPPSDFPNRVKIKITEKSLLNAAEASLPYGVSPYSEDFLLCEVLEKSDGGDIVFSSASKSRPVPCICEMLIKHDLIRPAVLRTVQDFSDTDAHYPHTLAGEFVGTVAMPFFYEKGEDSAEGYAKIPLNRILLSVISDENSPILAFYRRYGLLKLCEGRLALTCTEEIALLSFFVRLNAFFLRFKPIII